MKYLALLFFLLLGLSQQAVAECACGAGYVEPWCTHEMMCGPDSVCHAGACRCNDMMLPYPDCTPPPTCTQINCDTYDGAATMNLVSTSCYEQTAQPSPMCASMVPPNMNQQCYLCPGTGPDCCAGGGPPADCANPFGGANIPHGTTITAFQTSTVTCGNTCSSQIRMCNNGTLTGTYTNQNCSVSPPCPASCVNPFGGANVPHGNSITAYQNSTVACGGSCTSEVRTCNDGTLSGTYTNQTCDINPPCVGCTDETFIISLNPISTLPFPQHNPITLPEWDTDCSPPVNAPTEVRINSIPWQLPPGITISGDSSAAYLRSIPSSGGLIYSYKTQTAPPPPADCVNPFGGANIAHGASVTAYQASTVTCGNSCTSEIRTCNNGTLSGTYTHQNCITNPPCPASCINPFGGANIPHGTSVTAYQAASVTCGNSCVSEIRNCNNGLLSGSYLHQNCTVGACATWLICLETIHYEDNCSPGSTYTYNQVTPADCSGHSDNTVDNGLCDTVNHSYDHFSYQSVMCTANGSPCTSGAGCCSNSCQFLSGSWKCAP